MQKRISSSILIVTFSNKKHALLYHPSLRSIATYHPKSGWHVSSSDQGLSSTPSHRGKCLGTRLHSELAVLKIVRNFGIWSNMQRKEIFIVQVCPNRKWFVAGPKIFFGFRLGPFGYLRKYFLIRVFNPIKYLEVIVRSFMQSQLPWSSLLTWNIAHGVTFWTDYTLNILYPGYKVKVACSANDADWSARLPGSNLLFVTLPPKIL